MRATHARTAGVFCWGLIALLPMATAAEADESPCDTEAEVDRCEGDVEITEGAVILHTDVTCAVLRWRVDGDRLETLVVDGEERIELGSTPRRAKATKCTEVRDERDDAVCENLRGRIARAEEEQRAAFDNYSWRQAAAAMRRILDLVDRLPPGCCIPDGVSFGLGGFETPVCGRYAPGEARPQIIRGNEVFL